MITTTKILEMMVAAAEEQGVECEHIWNPSVEGVLESILINGKSVENTSHDEEYELALEAQALYAGDEREARAYYNN